MKFKKINYIAAPDLLIKPKTKTEITFEKIVQCVCDAWGIKPQNVFGDSRKREIIYPRQIIHYFCDKYLKLFTLQLVANKSGLKSHATVLNSVKTVNNLMQTDYDFRQRVEFIDTNLHLY